MNYPNFQIKTRVFSRGCYGTIKRRCRNGKMQVKWDDQGTEMVDPNILQLAMPGFDPKQPWDKDGPDPIPCEHCGNLFQYVEDHKCAGTKAEARALSKQLQYMGDDA